MRKRGKEGEEELKKKKERKKEALESRTCNAESDTEGKGRVREGRLQKAARAWVLSFCRKPVLK